MVLNSETRTRTVLNSAAGRHLPFPEPDAGCSVSSNPTDQEDPMTIRDWEPGDHAMLYLDADTEIRVTRTEHGDWVSDKGTRYDPALPARPIEAAAICGAKPPWPGGAGTPGCSKAAGHDGDHAGHDAVWADPDPAPLTGRAYVEDLERQRDRLRAELHAANEEKFAWRTRADYRRLKIANLERDNQRLERERDEGVGRLRARVSDLLAVREQLLRDLADAREEARNLRGGPCGEAHPLTGRPCILESGHAGNHHAPDFAAGHAPASTMWGHQPSDDAVVDAHVPGTCGTTCVFDGHIRACDLDVDHTEPHRSTGRAEVIWR